VSAVEFHHGDNREVLRRMIDDGVRVQSVVCDPPYGLTSVTKRFGKEGAAPALHGTDGAFQRASGGFMGQSWDASGIERDPEFWRLIWEILLPGGYCLAFSSPRTGHWMAVAMEQAGFVMHPFLGWAYGSGFPKAHDAAKAIDRELGQEGDVVPTGNAVKRMIPGAQQHATGDWTKTDQRQYQPGEYDPATAAAAAWDGWKYGAQSMKPALEPIYVAQRPFDQKNGALNILMHGVGALNIDGCRVGESGARNNGRKADTSPIYGDFGASQRVDYGKGRHPANLLHDGSDAVRSMFPDSKGQQGDVRGDEPSHTGDDNTHCYGEFGRVAAPKRALESDTSAARFFNAFPLDADPLFYCPKAGKQDRAGSKHPTVKPIALMRWCCRLVTPPGGTVLDPFAGSGTTGAGALDEGFNCILIEAHDDYATDIRRRFNLPSPMDDIDPLMELIG
jgi:hypothetical protein